MRIDENLAAHSLAVDYDIDPNAPPGVWVVSRGPSDANGVYTGIRVGRVRKNGQVWEYRAANVSLPSDKHYKGKNLINAGGGYRSAQCPNQPDLMDDLYVNPHFWSCVTRPDALGNRAIWAVHTPLEASGQSPHTVVQWYKIEASFDPVNNPPDVDAYREAGSDWLHDAAMAVNANEDIVIFFNRSYDDKRKYPGIDSIVWPVGAQTWTVSHEMVGPNEVVYRPGDVAWMDFTGCEPDPVMPCQFWGHQGTVSTLNKTGCQGKEDVTARWQSWLLRLRLNCPTFAIRGNLDMNQDGDLTSDDIAIYSELASEGDPEMDRTYEGVTDVVDFVDFMNEWNNPE